MLAALANGSSADTPPEVERVLEAAATEAAAMPRMKSLLVAAGDGLLVERYFNGTRPEQIANIKSVSKSVISTLVGIAIDRGHIGGLEQPIGAYFGPRLAGEAEGGKRAITIEHLLTMQAGLEPTSNRNYGAWVASADWIDYALRRPFVSAPGGAMLYSTGNTHLLSAIITQATGESTLAFARRVLSEPLGFHLAAWPRDPQGIYFGGNDMEMTPRQMAAFGRLFLNGGEHDGRQVVPREWVQASLVRRVESPREPGRHYGYGWWIREMAGLGTPYAWGYGGQFIVLVPTLDVVLVTTSDSTPGDDRRAHTRRLYDFFEHSILAPWVAAAATVD